MSTELLAGNFTPLGGLFVWLTNKTGANSVKGTAVRANSALDMSFIKAVVDIPDCIGVVYDNGVPDGSPCRVVVSGIAEVLFIGNATAGQLARTFITADAGYITGYVLAEAAPTSPFATDKHFCEIGHVLSSRVGAGLAKVNLHFN